MTEPRSRSLFDRLGEQPLVRVLAYYVVLFAGAAVAAAVVPGARAFLDANDFGAAGAAVGVPPAAMPDGRSGTEAALAVVALAASAVLLMLPVAWIYLLTRARQGFRQSFVQTLLVLPVVVAGVVVVVKHSVALAFGLAGIVAAVSFRNRLEDSKDAVYIFLATAVGLACGVQAVGVAAALSVAFNAVVVALWWSDFGRSPAGLQGTPAERRLQRALAIANRTHQFVSMVDREILKSLAPEQLAQVASRVAERRARVEAALDTAVAGATAEAPKPWRDLRVVFAEGHAPARQRVEAVLEADTKKWVVRAASSAAGPLHVEYGVRLRRKVPAALLEARLREAAGTALRELVLGPDPDGEAP